MLGMQLITHQTGPEGKRVQATRRRDPSIDRELISVSSSIASPASLSFMASASGGMEIEEVAAKDPNPS